MVSRHATSSRAVDPNFSSPTCIACVLLKFSFSHVGTRASLTHRLEEAERESTATA